ncbi:MAG: Crp/Fnr family transcriptional regulator [Terriglobia bacterium]|jgi:CRP-like cAMP-binding protein
MATKSQPADWEAALSGIEVGNTALEYAPNRDISTKQKEGVLTLQKSRQKVIGANGKGKPALVTANGKTQLIDWTAFLAAISRGKSALEYGANRTIYAQGDLADSVWYLQKGEVKLAVTSQQGKEAIVSVLGHNEFFGEGCLAGQPLRISTAVTVSDCNLYRIEKSLMVRLLHEQHGISELFITHLLSRNTRFEEDLVDQLFNPSEKRLARILLLLAHFGKESRAETVHPGINQEHLAQMVGTTRARVSHFMNKFRTLGFIDYEGSGALTVNSGLLSVILRD